MARLALLIGVSEYGVGIPALPECVLDVDAMQRVLIHPDMGGFAVADITVLKNPQRQAMEDAIYQLFHNRQKDDLLLFYFSGHGMTDEDENKLYLANKDTYNKENDRVYEPSAVAAAYINQRLNNSRSKRLVLILDCCYSGAFAREMSKGDNTINLENYLGGKGRAILTSSSATERSLGAKVTTEHGNSGLSIYTCYLVEGIETGAADLDNDGFIGVEELHEYTSKRVQEAAPAMNPKFYQQRDEGSTMILAKSPKDDSKLKYRKEVEKWVEPPLGKISSVARRLLKLNQIELGISVDDAESIEAEVLQPYTELATKLGEYEEAVIEALESGYPFSLLTEAALKAYQKGLELRDEDITHVEQRVLKAVKSSPPKIQLTSVKVDEKGEAEIFVEDLGNGVSLIMVKIPGGEFLMGSPTSEEGDQDWESPQHLVKVPEFYMGQTLVTQAQWQQMMGNNRSRFTGDGKLPVEQVSWLDTQKFCQKLFQRTQRAYRLPSEAEWEYACRAGTTTAFYFGETISSEVANYGQKLSKTTPVDNFPPNAFGLYDLHGNLWEWCEDHWHQNYQGAPADGSAWLSDDDSASRLLRGGSWDYGPRNCRSATRRDFTPDDRNFNVGFRVVCEIPRTL